MKYTIQAVDLFCGIGGLTHGMLMEGIDVVAGIDNDSTCKYGYEKNNHSVFLDIDIMKVTPARLNRLFGKREKGKIRVLAGCAPCQPYSKLNLSEVTEKQQEPLTKFAELIAATQPDIVSMENVNHLAAKGKYPAFSKFLSVLEQYDYKYDYQRVDVSEYGIPQKRKRLVLLASKLGPIKLIARTHLDSKVTVRDVIQHLPPIQHGQVCNSDPLHRARRLDDINLRRIKATPKNGGSSHSWSQDLVLECHKKESGKTYKGTVYGRMKWDEPAPTMTTQCIGLGNGRFGHPTQNRAISLREAAIFQTFPDHYEFFDPTQSMSVGNIARYIGNAVPVKLGSIIAQSIKNHVNTVYGDKG